MLTQEDLKAIGELITTAVTSSEQRMTACIDTAIAGSEQRMTACIDTAIAGSEQRMTACIDTTIAGSEQRMTACIDTAIAGSEQRMTAQITNTRTDIMSYIESHVEKQIHQIADGHVMLAEKMDRMENKIDNLQSDVDIIKGELVAQDYINIQTRNAIKLFTANQSSQIEAVHGEPGQMER